MEAAPGATETERLVVITGAPPNIQMAVSMLYTVRDRLGPFLLSVLTS
jgi:hypothetical protein